uniref:Uncharacterized protein n=1 Tax=Globodera rostochiensis TaxID=31243 RepID=A0A914HVA1_GLORO
MNHPDAFYDDFGPLNLALLFRFCQFLHALVLHHGPGGSGQQAQQQTLHQRGSKESSKRRLTGRLLHVRRKGVQIQMVGLFAHFDADEYEHFERVENGDLNFIDGSTPNEAIVLRFLDVVDSAKELTEWSRKRKWRSAAKKMPKLNGVSNAEKGTKAKQINNRTGHQVETEQEMNPTMRIKRDLYGARGGKNYYSCRKNAKRHRISQHKIPLQEAQDGSIKRIKLTEAELAQKDCAMKAQQAETAAKAGGKDKTVHVALGYSCRKNAKRHRISQHKIPLQEAQDGSIKRIKLTEAELAQKDCAMKAQQAETAAKAGGKDKTEDYGRAQDGGGAFIDHHQQQQQEHQFRNVQPQQHQRQQQQQTMYSSAAAAADDHHHAHHRFQHGDSVAGAPSAAASFYQPSQPSDSETRPEAFNAGGDGVFDGIRKAPQGTAAAPKGTKKSHKASTNPPAHFCPHCGRGLSSDYSLKRNCQSCPKLLGKEGGAGGGGGKKKGFEKAIDELHQIICDPDSRMTESPLADGS